METMLVHPGEILLDALNECGLSQRQLADRLGVNPRNVNEVIRGRRRVTAAMSLRLGRFFGQSERYWLNLQTEYDLREAERSVDLAGITPLAG